MIKNYFKTAFRGILKNKVYSLVNIVSLAVAIFVVYLGTSYIYFETSYDKFHKNHDDIFRLARTYRAQDYSIIGFPNWSDTNDETQNLLVKALKNNSSVKDITQFLISSNNEFLGKPQLGIQENEILTTNTPSSFVKMFTWKVITGSLNDFGTGTQKAILCASTARKLFGSDNIKNQAILHKPIEIAGHTYTLAAIIEDLPLNAHFNFNVALSNSRIDYWGSRIYVQRNKGVAISSVEKEINLAMEKFNPKLKGDELYKAHFLQPISNIHLNSNILYESKEPGNKSYITLIGFFSLFILIITLFNITNLTLALKSKTSKSIGVKKTMGASSLSFLTQSIVEGFSLSLIALPFTALLIYFFTPFFNEIMEVDISPFIFNNFYSLIFVVFTLIFISCLANLVPALYLSFKDTLALFKDSLKANSYQKLPVRKYLIASQFIIVIGITSVSYHILKQLSFIEHKDVGFSAEGVLYTYSSEENLSVFQEKLKQIPEIEYVGNGSTFAIQNFNQTTYKLEGDVNTFDDASLIYLDKQALLAYDLKTTLGEIPDVRLNLINRQAAKKLALSKGVKEEEIIGETIVTEPEYTDAETGQVGFPFTVDGIFEDINLFSLHNKVQPYFLTISPKVTMDGRSIIKYQTKNQTLVLSKIKSIFQGFDESIPLEIEFLSENMKKLYVQDTRTGSLILYLNLIAILLSSLGIIGMSVFLTQARSKEIGIRRILGASISSIAGLLNKEYIFLTLFAIGVSWPVAYYVSSKWLSNFAYQISINHLVFIFIGFCTLFWITLIVSVITFKTALVNPVESLKSE